MLKKLKGFGNYKRLIITSIVLLLLLFLLVILLGDKATSSLYFVCFASGMCSLIIGENNCLSVKKLGLGLTREKIEYNLIKELLILSVNSILLIGFDILFIFIVTKTLNIKLRFIIFTYLLSLILCLLIIFIKMNYKDHKLIWIAGVILAIIVGILFIKNYIIVDIILALIIVGLYFLNRYNIYHKELD